MTMIVIDTKFSNIVTLGDILKDNGYNNYLMIGSDSEFWW